MWVKCLKDGELLSGRKAFGLPYNCRIPLPHTGAYPPICGTESPYSKEDIFMQKNSSNLSIFTAGYWITAAKEIKKLHTLTFAGMTIALAVITNSLFIPVGENLHISFTFLIFSIGALVFGPAAGLLIGMIYDVLNYIVHPVSIFFPGYTLSSMLEFFIYGLFLYRSRITVLKVFAAKFIVNYGIHVLLGSLWSKMLYHKGYIFFFTKSLVKNTIMLPIEVIMFVALLQIIVPVLSRIGTVQKQSFRKIPFI